MSSNVARADYAGSAACRPCHPDAFAAWERSPMHRMTRDARGATVLAPFDGTRWSFGGDTAVLDQKGGERFVRIEPARGPARTYRLTRVIGGRTREDFAGVDANGGADEMVLPISYVFRTHALRYKGYSVMIHERDELRAGPVWSQACIFCHNTVPEIDRWLGAIAGPRAPPYQGVLVEGWLAPERRARAAVDPLGLGRVLGAEVALLGGSLPPSGAPPSSEARAAIGVIRSGFDGHALVEEGIGCEACHGGAREHTQVPAQRPSFVPRAPWLDVRPPEVSARVVSRDRRPGPRTGARNRPRARIVDPGASHQSRLRSLPSGPLLPLSVHVGRRAARRDGRRQLDRTRARPATFCWEDAPTRCRAWTAIALTRRRATSRPRTRTRRALVATASSARPLACAPTPTTTRTVLRAFASHATCRARTWGSTVA